jgi:hypothetical protein
MWIEPSNITTLNVEDKFNVTIFVNVTLKSFAWQVKLHFNSTFFNATKIGYTSDNRSDFFSEYSSMPITPEINNEEGYVLHGESLLSNDEKAPGYGSLMWVELSLKEIPPQNHSALYFSTPYGSDTFILTPNIDLIPMETMNGVFISVEPTGSPLFPDITDILIIVIVVVLIIALLVIIRKRRSKEDENQ